LRLRESAAGRAPRCAMGTAPKARYLMVREIELMLESVRGRFVMLCMFITIACPAVPVLALLGLFGWPCVKGYFRDEKETFVGLCASVVISLVVFAVPIFCLVYNPRALQYYTHILDDYQVSHIEVYSPLFSFLCLLYLAGYITVISLDVECMVDHAKRTRLRSFKSSAAEVSLIPLDKDTPAKISLPGLVESLEGLPGWAVLDEPGAVNTPRGHMPRRADHFPSVTPRPDSEEAEQHGSMVGSLDYVTFGAPKAAKQRMLRATQGHVTKLLFFFSHQWTRCRVYPYQTALMVGYGCFRALVPRLWVMLYWGHSFSPTDPYVATMCWHGIALTAFCGSMWLVLFNNARIAYGQNVNQMKLVSALIHLEKRHTYLKTVVKPRADAEEYAEVSQRLPYFSMDSLTNIKAWWNIREYAVIDTMDERMTLEITILLVFVVMFLTVAHSMWDFVHVKTGVLTSFQVLSILDLTVLGLMSMWALMTYVELNDIMRDQADILVNARHELLTPESKLMDMTDEELLLVLASKQGRTMSEGGERDGMGGAALEASDFLSHLCEVIRVDDFVQTLFGVEVTAYNVAQVVLGMVAGLGSAAGVLYELLIKKTGATISIGLVSTSLVQQWGT
jgi:hypothetical protein